MDAGLLAQYVIVGLAVAASAGYVLATRFPAAVRRVRGRVALGLIDSGRAPLARLGRRLAPAPSAPRCGDCSGCD